MWVNERSWILHICQIYFIFTGPQLQLRSSIPPSSAEEVLIFWGLF